ncbi:MAG: type II secretion system protein, partial [Thermodesulfobacteriota bacterium]
MKKTGKKSGFTLLELILALTVGAILGVMLVSYLGLALERSAEPVVQALEMSDLRQVMENITADYYNLLNRSDALDELERRIGSGHSDPSTGYGAYSATTSRITF